MCNEIPGHKTKVNLGTMGVSPEAEESLRNFITEMDSIFSYFCGGILSLKTGNFQCSERFVSASPVCGFNLRKSVSECSPVAFLHLFSSGLCAT